MMTTLDRSTPTAVGVGYLEVNPRAYRATLRGHRLALSASQLEVLRVLIVNRDRVVSRNELAQAVGLGHAATVDVLLSSLRRLLGEGAIRNVRSRGWILEPSAFQR
jgi:two-component system OmpR family response regulator